MLYLFDLAVEAVGLAIKPSYSVREVAKILGTSPATVYRMLEEGKLFGIRPRSHYRIFAREIERFINDTNKEED